MKKICCRCKQELDVKNFKSNKRKNDGLQCQCIECQKIYRRDHYLKNKQKYLNKTKKRKEEFRSWFLEFKKTLKCKLCGNTHPACLDFHHRNPNDKEKTVSQMVNTLSKKKLLEEINKCDVLCANCHRIFHFEN